MLKPVSFLALGGISNKDQVCNEVLNAANLPCHTEHLKQDLQRILKHQVHCINSNVSIFAPKIDFNIIHDWYENANTDAKTPIFCIKKNI